MHENGVVPRGAELMGLPPLVSMQIVVVSHGLDIAYDRARGFEAIGYRVAACGDPKVAARFVGELSPEAIIVDLGREMAVPADVVAQLREVTDVPILVAGCTGSVAEMMRVLECGADSYTRPQPPTEELDLRLRALFRRMRAGTAEHRKNGSQLLTVGDIEIDQGGQVVRKRGMEVPLSPTEFRLLVTLAEHPGEVVPSKALIARVWGNQYSGETHYLRLYVRYLRQKLEDNPSQPTYIVNRWGTGYALETPSQAA